MTDVSIIIPVYNVEDFLGECLESIKHQSLTDIQIILVADCPTDHSLNLLQEFGQNDHRVEIHKLEKNSGPAVARNLGLQNSRGTFVRFVDSDDILPLESTSRLFNAASKSGAELVRGNCMFFENGSLENAAPMRNIEWVSEANELNYRKQNFHGFPWCHPVFLFRREFLLAHHLCYPELRRGEDPVFLLKALLASENAQTIPDTVYLYRTYKKISDRFKISSELSDYFKHYVELREIWYSQNMSQEWKRYFNSTFWWFWEHFVTGKKDILLANYKIAHLLFQDLTGDDITLFPTSDQACILTIRDSSYGEFMAYLDSEPSVQ